MITIDTALTGQKAKLPAQRVLHPAYGLPPEFCGFRALRPGWVASNADHHPLRFATFRVGSEYGCGERRTTCANRTCARRMSPGSRSCGAGPWWSGGRAVGGGRDRRGGRRCRCGRGIQRRATPAPPLPVPSNCCRVWSTRSVTVPRCTSIRGCAAARTAVAALGFSGLRAVGIGRAYLYGLMVGWPPRGSTAAWRSSPPTYGGRWHCWAPRASTRSTGGMSCCPRESYAQVPPPR